MFESTYSMIMTKMSKYQAEGKDKMTYSVIVQNIYTLKYNALNSSSYIKLPKELHHSRKEQRFKMVFSQVSKCSRPSCS